MVIKCQVCKGLGCLELEHGLILSRCETCKGKGEVEIDDNGITDGTGHHNRPLGSKNTRKPRKSTKLKARKVV